MPETLKKRGSGRGARPLDPQPEPTPDVREPGPRSRYPLWLRGLAPLALLALLVFAFLRLGPLGVFRAAFPPVEVLTIDRVSFPEPNRVRVDVVNGGPEPVTVAQLFIDDASWVHSIDGDRTIERLGRRTLMVPYPWVEGEPHTITLVTSTGLTFSHDVAVATQTPTPTARYIGTFALLGLYVGVVPVFLGLLWLPFLRDIPRRWVDFFLSLTIGLLVFLGVDAIGEALELSARVAGAYQGLGLVLIGVLATPMLLAALGSRRGSTKGARSALYVSMLIALGTFLVIGFLLHNTTEGLGIVAPLAGERVSVRSLVLLGALAGVPTILGAWLGGFTYSPVWTTLFFAIGAGAIVQVVYELWKLFARRGEGGLTTPLNAAGVVAGLLIMWLTGLVVAA